MSKLLSLVLLWMVSSSLGAGTTSNARPAKHYTNLIVGGGPAGLYTAWRLSSARAKNESTAIYEWSPHRLGGRVFTKEFSGGAFLELGAMRFTDEHELLNQVIKELDLTKNVRPFRLTDNPLYYLRGRHMFKSNIKASGAPYNTKCNKTDPAELFHVLTAKMNLTMDRAGWCKFFDEGKFPADFKSTAFSKNDNLGNIGYWNLLMDQLDDEGLKYASDASGFTSSVLNSNAAYTMLLKTRSHNLSRLRGGFKDLIDALVRKSRANKVAIEQGQRLTEFYWNVTDKKFYSTFEDCTKNGKEYTVTSDRLFLCVPKRSLEMIKERDVVGQWPDEQKRVLKHTQGRFYIDSVIQEPAYKIGLLYNKPWWLTATHKPFFGNKSDEQQHYGPAVTDLPLRTIFYFGRNSESKKQGEEPRYGILASYDDMNNAYFWWTLETPANETLKPHPSGVQSLTEGGKVTRVMHEMLQTQLNLVHFGKTTMQVPEAEEGFFMNWGHDPYGSGYHTWKAHYKIGDVQQFMTQPSKAVGMDAPLYVAGETYAFDQGWIEGALTTAETVLVDKIGLKPLLKLAPGKYPLICPRSK